MPQQSPNRTRQATEFIESMASGHESLVEAVPTASLVTLLNERDPVLTGMAASVLGGRTDARGVCGLTDVLKEINDSCEIQGVSVTSGNVSHILMALERQGAGARAAVPEIARALMRGDDPGHAARALKAIGTVEAVSALLKAAALPEDSTSRSHFAVDALSGIREHTLRIVPALNQLFLGQGRGQLASSFLSSALNNLGWSTEQQDWTAWYKEAKLAFDRCKPFEGQHVQFTDARDFLHVGFLKKVEITESGSALATVVLSIDQVESHFVLGQNTEIQPRHPAA